MDELLREIKNCTICKPNLPFEPRPVVQLDPLARILIAAQAPGKRVHDTGIPFNDASGIRLREWLGIEQSVFYDKKKVAILPMGFCYPGRGKSGDLPPRKECAKTWHKLVSGHLRNVQLTLFIGRFAQRYYFPQSKSSTLTQTIMRWRSFWPDVIPLPHPSPRNIIWFKRNPWYEKEVLPVLQQRVAEVLSNSGLNL